MNQAPSYSTAFDLLDERIQRFVWSQGWQELHAVQEAAIPLILEGECDVIVTAATASGKTEAAFLPALTRFLAVDGPALIIYISPLKALINDQFGRLNALCEHLHIPVWAWHGDISSSRKARFTKSPSGVLLITPEALEATLCRRGAACGGIFRHALYIVVDELHAFIGTERGKQLQTLLHRIEHLIGRQVRRIGLSATLGEIALAASFLRPGGRCDIADAGATGGGLKVLLKGCEEPAGRCGQPTSSPAAVPHADHLFRVLRGSNNLVFPNSRAEVERYTMALNEMCENAGLPREFWPHHGSLARDVRLETEEALRQSDRPATAICTNTLELGIDIGAVKSVAQIGPPPSIASLRQRLGRSGRRRGDAAILWGYTTEVPMDFARSIQDRLRLDTVEFTAMIDLMVAGQLESPASGARHFSTLVQQILAVVAQEGGLSGSRLFAILCGPGAPFAGVPRANFTELLQHLRANELLELDSGGNLLHGPRGEKLVNHYTFYAAFAEEDEYRILCSERLLGTVPINNAFSAGDRLLFAGRMWKIDGVLDAKKTIEVSPAAGGAPPAFSGGRGRTHSLVRQAMKRLLASGDQPPFLDQVALRFLVEAREQFGLLKLNTDFMIEQGNEVLLFTWLGDATNEALACLFRYRGFRASAGGPAVVVNKRESGADEIVKTVTQLAEVDPPDPDVLLDGMKNLRREKWDWALTDSLLREAYASQHLNVAEAHNWLRSSCTFLSRRRDAVGSS